MGERGFEEKNTVLDWMEIMSSFPPPEVALVLVSLLLLSSLGLGCFSRLTLFELVGAAPAGPGHSPRKCLEAPGRLASLLLLFLFVVVPRLVDQKKEKTKNR